MERNFFVRERTWKSTAVSDQATAFQRDSIYTLKSTRYLEFLRPMGKCLKKCKELSTKEILYTCLNRDVWPNQRILPVIGQKTIKFLKLSKKKKKYQLSENMIEIHLDICKAFASGQY